MTKFEINFLDDYSDESLLNEIRRVTEEHPNEKLTTKNFNNWSGRVSAKTIRRRFDNSWEKALEQAGLADRYGGHAISSKMRSQTGRRLTSDELITELKRVYSLTGRDCLTREDFDDRSITSYRTIRSRFGSWAIALKIAGIPQSELANKNWTEAQCFENLADVWVHYQRQPSYREMSQPPSMIRGKIYATRWGTWHKALRAFADSANSEDQLSGENEKVPVSGISGPVPPRISRKPEDRREVRPALRIKVLSRDRFRCVFCGRSPATHLNIHDFHIDHILAVVNGGKTTLDNLQTLCPDCNLGKGRMVLPRVTPDFTTN